jgi:large subunit ribosomal protein L3
MVNTILGRKLGMTQVWDEDDNVVPVTVILAGPCTVSQVKTKETDGYEAVQIGFGDIKAKKVNKPMAGHFEKAGVEPMRYLREVRVEDASQYKTGDKVTVADFADVTAVDVTGTSKGKGFQGTIKRWNFHRGPMTHGSRNQRKPGSIGQCAYPARVRKGLHMAGHMGDERVTVKNLKLVRVDTDQNLLLVKGAVPGGKNALVQVRMA